MADYILSCCSTVDLNNPQMDARNIHYCKFHYELDNQTYLDDMGASISMADFYKKMSGGAMTRTSQLNQTEYMAYFEPFLKDGKDILHLTLSSGISGTFNSARLAAEELREQYPDRKLIILDSLAASSGYGLLMDKLADLRDEGMTIDELAAWAEEHKLECIHWFFSSDLTFYIRGGRVSKAAGIVGQVLNICPLLDVSNKGELIVREKVRTKRKVIRTIANKMIEQAQNGAAYADKCYISCSACHEDAKAVAAIVEEAFPHLNGKVQIFDIGPTIGAHTGPGTVALFFWGAKRVN